MPHLPPTILRLVAGLLLVLAAASTPAAILEVETAADEINSNGLCSLREAVINANNGDQSGSTDCPAGTPPMVGDADAITFSPTTDGTPIVLTLTGAGENAALTGDLDVTDNLGIYGNGPDATIIDGNGEDRIFDGQIVDPPLNQLSLIVESMTLRGGASVERGGAIYVRDTSSALLVENARITENFVLGVSLTAGGGGVWTEGHSLFRDTLISGNEAGAAPGFGVLGGGINANGNFAGRRITVTDNLASGSSAPVLGGGLVLGGDEAFVEVTDSIIRGNTAEGIAAGSAAGGGLVVQDILIPGLGDASNIESTEISMNQALSEGGSAQGGGLYLGAPGTLHLRNTTVSGNQAGDAEADTARGGGIMVFDATLAMALTTITDNAVQSDSTRQGGGLLTDLGSAGVINTLVANNTANGGTGPDCWGPVSSLGYSLLGSNSGCSWSADIGDQIGDVTGGAPPIDPLLGPLADNGGSSRTHAPLAGSPVIDAGDPNSATCPVEDQRGYLRPIDGDNDGTARCDIGAHEHDSFLDVFFVDGFESG